MSVQVGNALFDSVTGIAFGPAFDSLEDAEEFLDWMRARDYADERLLNSIELHRAYEAWREETDRV